MYLPATSPIPQNSQMPPPQRSMDASRLRLWRVDEAIKRAREAQNCAAFAGASGQPVQPSLPALYGPNLTRNVTQQVAAPTDSEARRNALIAGTSTLTDEQREALRDAPEVVEQYSTGICAPEPIDTHCPQTVSAPAWTNAVLNYPAPVCGSAASLVVKRSPWLLLLLVLGGGLALNALVDD